MDFFVLEAFQRQGLGKKLLDAVAEKESCCINRIAWDKPTAASLALLSKFYGLHSYNKQPNNFVVFDDFFA
jgi:hypothetical protein